MVTWTPVAAANFPAKTNDTNKVNYVLIFKNNV